MYVHWSSNNWSVAGKYRYLFSMTPILDKVSRNGRAARTLHLHGGGGGVGKRGGGGGGGVVRGGV